MSKSNVADFSAFDFNDSSDNSDLPSRPSYLSRANLNSINHNNDNTENFNHNNSNIRSGDSNNSNINKTSNRCGSNGNNGNDSRNINGSADEEEEDDDDEDEDDDEEDDEDDDENEEEEESIRNSVGGTTAINELPNEPNTGGGHITNSAEINNKGNGNGIVTTSNCSDNNNRSNNDNCKDIQPCGSSGDLGDGNAKTDNNNTDTFLMATLVDAGMGVGGVGGCSNSTTVASNATESNGNFASVGLLDGALGGSNANNCNELVRSGSVSMSNNSTSTNHNGSGAIVPGSCSGGIAPSEAGSAAGTNGSGHSERKKYRHQNYSKNIYIGTKNAEKWEHTRTRLQFKNDVEFVTYLLNLADNDSERLANLPSLSVPTTPTKSLANNFKLEPNLSVKEFSKSQTESNQNTPAPTRRKYKKRVQFSDAINGVHKMKDFSNFSAKAKKHEQTMKVVAAGGEAPVATNDTLPEVLDCRIAEKIKNELEEKSASKPSPNALCLKKQGIASTPHSEDDKLDEMDTGSIKPVSVTAPTTDLAESSNTTASNSNFRVRVRGKRNSKNLQPPTNAFPSLNAGVTGAIEEDDDEVEDESDGDDEDEEMDEEAMAREMKNEQNFVEEEDEHTMAFRSPQSCRECSISHDYKICPLRTAMSTITDAVDLAEWIERKNLEALAKMKAHAQRQAKHDNEDDEDMDESSQMSELETKPLITFAEASVPAEFELHNVEPNVTGVFARTEVRAFTKLGPLIGQLVQNTDLKEGSDMKWIFETCEGGAEKSQLLSCDNPNTSNWLRYIRPAPTYDERNVNLVSIEHQKFFVTCREVKNGMELLYWSDDCNSMWRKKNSEKTNCGGCNLNFDHPLYYRTHCSIFHDPSMSLTIRKYQCKVCGEAVLGKDNVLKHATEKHDGQGAYQCQFCNKFFLRLNYLEMHRTYSCAANPNRARPLCDFCGRKFCQPQKLKAHIKRMHSDMAEVLRDFQCKLCSKLLGSRAALQRHSKEVHSRNSTVVSCPRCQKLFQNRSNLKIHMLTHSGVRPFKCSETECNAAFTTKQCLQFHYKKVHNYTQEQMPKIERSVAYTFDAYSGGMKVDFLAEQAPRRRRKSLEDQNSRLSSSIQSDTEFSDDNIFEAIKKSGKSIKDLCRNEPNLSLLSSKISSIFSEKVVGSRKRKKKKETSTSSLSMMGGSRGTEEESEHERLEEVRRKQANAQLSLVESFLTTTAQRLTAQQQVQQVVAAAAAVSAMAGAGGTGVDDTNKMHMMQGLSSTHHAIAMTGHAVAGMLNDDEDEEDDDDVQHPHDGTHVEPQDNSFHHHAGISALGQNLVVSKGSKKWISGDERYLVRDCEPETRCAMGGGNGGDTNVAAVMGGAAACMANNNDDGIVGNNDMGIPGFVVPPNAVDDANKLIGHNRDLLARLMSSANANNAHNANREEDESSSFLDVVESNNNNNTGQLQQYHQNNNNNVVPNTSSASNLTGSGGQLTDTGNENTPNHQVDDQQMQMNPITHPQSFMSNFYNNANARLSGAGNATTSASMLVEAALNSVGNMMDTDNNELKVPSDSNINTDSPMSGHVDSEVVNRFSADASGSHHPISSIDNLENELKLMKNLSGFSMQIPPLPMFPNSGNNMNACNISPNESTPTNPQSNQNNNDIDVDAGSTPREHHLNNSATDSDGFSSTHHRTPPSPQPISPGRDYGMFSNNNTGGPTGTPGGPGTAGSASSGNSGGGNSNNINISASSPLPTMQAQRRTASSVGSTYPEHELISPASSPSIPRYNFNGEMMRHKREEQDDTRQAMGHNHHLSSDDENSIIPQNSTGQDMRMKFSQSQIDLMYSKYESIANAANLKYNNQDIDSPVEYRTANSNSGANTANDLSDLQGLDMSRSSTNASNYHHNFQLPNSASSNIASIGRYHHHIYDILSEREQPSQQSQQQQQHHSSAMAAAAAVAAQQQQEHSSQLAMQQHQSSMHNMLPDQLGEQEHDQATSVDLSRTASYVVPSPPQLPYNHPHHDMLRMASLDLTPNTNMSVGNNRSFLSTQMQHQSRESLEHHRLLSTVEQHRILAASNAAADQHRLLVDPTAHLLMEQNNRLLSTDQSRLLGDSAQNRHMARSFGAYHQVASGNYHPSVRPPVLPTANHHTSNPTNYHPFPAYY